MLALLALVLFPYWPGAPNTPTDNRPVYEQRIPVIDTIDVRDHRAMWEWNDCGSVRMVDGTGVKPESPGTITILPGIDEWPRGGWAYDHGVVYLPLGGWERSIPVIIHELGHALGFGHTNRHSIMDGADHVTAIDCEGLRRYYG